MRHVRRGRKSLRVVERVREVGNAGDAEHETKVADAVYPERLIARIGRRLFQKP